MAPFSLGVLVDVDDTLTCDIECRGRLRVLAFVSLPLVVVAAELRFLFIAFFGVFPASVVAAALDAVSVWVESGSAAETLTPRPRRVSTMMKKNIPK